MTQKWAPAGVYPTSGTGLVTTWGTEPEGDEVRRTYSALYEVIVQYNDGEIEDYTITYGENEVSKSTALSELNKYTSWKVGEQVVLSVDVLGFVHNAEHMPVLEKKEK